ncbi:NAD-glutamate dehydrogenase domain-containing protein [Desulfospira joergensenii]|uniref:NAD-glutamate dehydrogenase domain-containing protein n=1 Tax=Desulfospira joergensenii TaxID=53329 RepID=UPI0003B6743E|nr:NAD-glutamate dehydrogenase domain-containing protein [Desulfospira joergensenii]
MDIQSDTDLSSGAQIVNKAQSVKLNPSLLYEAVIDISSEGLITAKCINRAAGILLNDLGLPDYFFETITKESLKNILASIAKGINLKGDKVELYSWVADIDFDLFQGRQVQRVRIATKETRDSMEKVLGDQLAGHRREYYYNPDSEYYTHVFRPETVKDFPDTRFRTSRFLFSLDQDYASTPRLTRDRYERFLEKISSSVTPLIEVFNLSDIGEIRFMFNSDFKRPQLAVFRRLFADHGLTITRAYWEPYHTKTSVVSSVCSLYVRGELSRDREKELVDDLRSFLSFSVSDITRLYVDGLLSFREMLFAGNAIDFTHMFIYKERGTRTDRDIMENLVKADHRESFSERIHESNKFTYVSRMIMETVEKNPDLVQFLFQMFESKFNPKGPGALNPEAMEKKEAEFDKILSVRFMDYPIGRDIFTFMFKFIPAVLKTNFYKAEKRSFAFRMDDRILDPLVFNQAVFGIFFVSGHYACGTHLRADDIARGGLRLIRVTESNYAMELDNAVLLNYALGPKAQRLKHKDICESGSKGVVVPHALYAPCSMDALYDYTEGIMDLMLPGREIIDHYGRPEMIFFGPDEGTAPLMDAVAFRAKQRGYPYWRTITTGKSFGIPHDTYGILENGDLFGLIPAGEKGTELQINGETKALTTDMEEIYSHIGGRVETSGMTTTSVMGSFRTLIDHYGQREEDLNLMMTGGPDGDLGSNEIQCYKGKICLIIDGGSILFDPEGLDKKELMKIAFMRHTSPRANSLAFDGTKLSKAGFQVPLREKNIQLPDGTLVEDGAVFHRKFITDPGNRKYIEQANIRAFIPCGGFKDTVNHGNVREFIGLFKELEFIVEGANVFFDDASRRYIAGSTAIKQIKDSTANKGGVFSSAVAEVLTAFLFEDEYEKRLLEDVPTRWALIRDVLDLVTTFAGMEARMLIHIHEKNPDIPLFVLSEKTSEEIFAFQGKVAENMDTILSDPDLLWHVLEAYIPKVLVEKLGREAILTIMNSEKMTAYRNAIITKKLAALAFYHNGLDWEAYLEKAGSDFSGTLHALFE